MTAYVKSTNFASKDSLASGNPLKIVKGTEIDTEFNNIAISINTKADTTSPPFTGVPTAPTAVVGTNTAQIATTAFVTAADVAVAAAVAAETASLYPTKTGTGAEGTWGIDVTGNAATATTATTAQNAIDIAAGAVGAPRIVGAAAKRLQDYPVLTVTAADTYSANLGIDQVSGTTSTSSASNVVARTLTIKTYTGALRFVFTQTESSSFTAQSQSTAEVYKNNGFIQSFDLQTDSSASAIRTLDISIAPDDVIEIRHRVSINASLGTSTIGGVSVFGSDGYTPRDLYIAQSEVNNP